LAAGWSLRVAWWPVFERAAESFPETGASVTNGNFVWPEPQPRILADAPHLGIAVRPDATEPPGRIADLQLELTPSHVRLAGVAGFVELPWPPDVALPLGRHEAVAAWGAWRRPLLAAATTATATGVFLLWTVLATALAIPARIAAWILRRELTLSGSWRMAAAAMLAGSVVMFAGVFGYTVRLLSWPGLAAVLAGHVLIGGLWLVWGILERPAAAKKEKAAKNPFDTGETKPPAKATKKKRNPFEPSKE
jgi:hypothetical protein